jgi:hypothetical protein
MSETVNAGSKALALASVWALLVGFLVENWDALAGAILSIIPAEYAGIAAGVFTLIFKVLQMFFKTAPKKLDTRY